jgi:hypothetical protein
MQLFHPVLINAFLMLRSFVSVVLPWQVAQKAIVTWQAGLRVWLNSRVPHRMQSTNVVEWCLFRILAFCNSSSMRLLGQRSGQAQMIASDSDHQGHGHMHCSMFRLQDWQKDVLEYNKNSNCLTVLLFHIFAQTGFNNVNNDSAF